MVDKGLGDGKNPNFVKIGVILFIFMFSMFFILFLLSQGLFNFTISLGSGA